MKSQSRENVENPWLAMAGWLKDSPLLEDWQAAIQEYRRQRDVKDGIETNHPYPKSEGGRLLAAICEVDFQLGELYSRQEISEVLGGSIQIYLPYVDGKVVCGCFDPSESMNPNAPEEILFGEPYPTPIIDQTARMVFEQGQNGSAIPVFLKRSSNQWQYIGEYLCIGMTHDERVVQRKKIAHPSRRAFSGVLRFEKV